MADGFGWKAVAVVLGGLGLLGIFLWQAIRWWTAYSKLGGPGNLIGGVVFTLLIVAWIVAAVRMVV